MNTTENASATNTVTQADIVRGLRELGLEAGDTVLVHTSMKSFGQVDGGPEAIIEALLEVLGPQGCLVMSTLTIGVKESPVVFDVRETASVAGLVTNVFRKRPNAYRSHHPVSSAAAEGRGAEVIARFHSETPCGLISPIGQVYLRGGWCLFMGAPWASNTMFHVAEELIMPAYLNMAEFHNARLIDEQGAEHTVSFKRYNCYQGGVIRDLESMGPRYEASGAVRHTHIGNSDCRMIRAGDVVDITVALLQDHPEQIFTYQNDEPDDAG